MARTRNVSVTLTGATFESAVVPDHQVRIDLVTGHVTLEGRADGDHEWAEIATFDGTGQMTSTEAVEIARRLLTAHVEALREALVEA